MRKWPMDFKNSNKGLSRKLLEGGRIKGNECYYIKTSNFKEKFKIGITIHMSTYNESQVINAFIFKIRM